MRFRTSLLRLAALLYLAAALLLPSVGAGAQALCCPAAGCVETGACAAPPEGCPDTGHGAEDGEDHEGSFCVCSTCQVLSIRGNHPSLPAPVFLETLGIPPVPFPSSVVLSTPERPPSA